MSTPTSAPVTDDRPAVVGDRREPVPRPDAIRKALSFDLGAGWTINPKVALRPEPFGALLYHFGTRKLSFLKNLTVVGIVKSLADHDTAESALGAAGVAAHERPLYLQALSALADSGMIVRR